jgi:hypothetical protein
VHMEDPQWIVDEIAPLGPWLHEQLEAAVAGADEHVARRHPHRTLQQGFHRTNVARCDFAFLAEDNPPTGWTVGSIRNNGRVQLTNAAQDITFRVLHDPRLFTPAPGHSLARNLYWQQKHPELTLFRSAKLIACWGADLDGVVTVRIVRPIGVWKYGSQEKVDLAFIMPREAAGFDELGFTPSDEGIELVLPVDNPDVDVEQRGPAIPRDEK